MGKNSRFKKVYSYVTINKILKFQVFIPRQLPLIEHAQSASSTRDRDRVKLDINSNTNCNLLKMELLITNNALEKESYRGKNR